jgi:hypothetical protein
MGGVAERCYTREHDQEGKCQENDTIVQCVVVSLTTARFQHEGVLDYPVCYSAVDHRFKRRKGTAALASKKAPYGHGGSFP